MFISMFLICNDNKHTLARAPQSLPMGKEGSKRLMYWYIEDAIKRRYTLFVTALEECSRDNLEFLKEKSTKVWTL